MYDKKSQTAQAAGVAIQRMAHWHFVQIHAQLNQSVDDDYAEATAALRLLQEDIWALCPPVDAQSADHGITLRLQRKASRSLTRAFAARGAYDHPSWSNLVANIRVLLRRRSRYGGAGDEAARARLMRFVRENADALRTPDGPSASGAQEPNSNYVTD